MDDLLLLLSLEEHNSFRLVRDQLFAKTNSRPFHFFRLYFSYTTFVQEAERAAAEVLAPLLVPALLRRVPLDEAFCTHDAGDWPALLANAKTLWGQELKNQTSGNGQSLQAQLEIQLQYEFHSQRKLMWQYFWGRLLPKIAFAAAVIAAFLLLLFMARSLFSQWVFEAHDAPEQNHSSRYIQ